MPPPSARARGAREEEDLHGIERIRKIPGEVAEQDQGIVRVVVRYADGREVRFIPDAASREVFDEDDLLEMKKVMTRASAASEWSEVPDVGDPGG